MTSKILKFKIWNLNDSGFLYVVWIITSRIAKFYVDTIINSRDSEIWILILLMSSTFSNDIKSHIAYNMRHTNVDNALENWKEVFNYMGCELFIDVDWNYAIYLRLLFNRHWGTNYVCKNGDEITNGHIQRRLNPAFKVYTFDIRRQRFLKHSPCLHVKWVCNVTCILKSFEEIGDVQYL